MDRKERTIFITIIANVILVLLRFFLANLSGSVGLRANAWHSITDVFVTTVVLLGLIIARMGSKKFNKVFSKAENVLAIFVSLFIFYMGLELLFDALSNDGTELRYVPFVAAGAFVGVLINYFMARYKIYVGEQVKSQSLIADGYHSKMDMYCSIAVLVGIIGSLFGMSSLDKIAAIVAMIFLLISGYEILMDNFKALTTDKNHSKGESAHDHGHIHFEKLWKNKKLLAGSVSIFCAAYILSGVYFINFDEVGIVKRFGAVVKDEVQPGMRYKLPAPFEEAVIVKKDSIQKLDLGMLELLTGDTNLVNVEMSIQYKVVNAADFALNVNNLESLIRAAGITSIRKISGENEIDYLLTSGKTEVEAESQSLLQSVMDRNSTGIQVIGVQLKKIAPPEAVMASFQDLASARQDKSIYINEALAYQNTVIPQANGDAYKAVKEAEGYKLEKVQNAQGDAVLFTEKLKAYQQSKSVTEFRLYMEAMDKILPNVQKILLGGNIKVNGADLWISNNQSGGN